MERAYFKYAGFENFGVCAGVEAAISIPKAFAQRLQFFQSYCKAAAKFAALFYL